MGKLSDEELSRIRSNVHVFASSSIVTQLLAHIDELTKTREVAEKERDESKAAYWSCHEDNVTLLKQKVAANVNAANAAYAAAREKQSRRLERRVRAEFKRRGLPLE